MDIAATKLQVFKEVSKPPEVLLEQRKESSVEAWMTILGTKGKPAF